MSAPEHPSEKDAVARRPPLQATPDASLALQTESRAPSSEAPGLSELHQRFGNELVQRALYAGAPAGLEAAIAGELAASVTGLGAGALSSNAAVSRLAAGQAPDLGALSKLSLAGGRPLSAAQRARFEPAMGMDLSAVRLHDDARAAAMAEAIQAVAFTVGAHVFLGRGASEDGQLDRVLAHELTHVRQHFQGRLPSAHDGPQVSSPNDPAEREAYAAEDRVLAALPEAPSEAPLVSDVGGAELDPIDASAHESSLSEGAALVPSAPEAQAHRRALEGVSVVELLERSQGAALPQAMRERVSKVLYGGGPKPEPEQDPGLVRALTQAADAAIQELGQGAQAPAPASDRVGAQASQLTQGLSALTTQAAQRFDGEQLVREQLGQVVEGGHLDGAIQAGAAALGRLGLHEGAVQEGLEGMAQVAIDALLGKEEETEGSAEQGAEPASGPAFAAEARAAAERAITEGARWTEADGERGRLPDPSWRPNPSVEPAKPPPSGAGPQPVQAEAARAEAGPAEPSHTPAKPEDLAVEREAQLAPPELAAEEALEQAAPEERTEEEREAGEAPEEAQAVPQQLEGEEREALAPEGVLAADADAEVVDEAPAHTGDRDAEAEQVEALATPAPNTEAERQAARAEALAPEATPTQGSPAPAPVAQVAAPEQAPEAEAVEVGAIALPTTGEVDPVSEGAELEADLEQAQERLEAAQTELQALNAELERLRAEDAQAKALPPEEQDASANQRRSQRIASVEDDIDFANNDVARGERDLSEAQSALDAHKAAQQSGGGGGGGGGAGGAAQAAADAAQAALEEGGAEAAAALEADAQAEIEAREAAMAELEAQVSEQLSSQTEALSQQHASALTSLEAQLSAQAAALEATAAQAEAQVSAQVAQRRAELEAQLAQDADQVEQEEVQAEDSAVAETEAQATAAEEAAAAEVEVILSEAQVRAEAVRQAGQEAAAQTRAQAKSDADACMSAAESEAASARDVGGGYETDEEREQAEAEADARADAILAEAEAEAARILQEGEAEAEQQIADAEAAAVEVEAQAQADAEAAQAAAEAAAALLQASLDTTLDALSAAAEAALSAVGQDESAIQATLDAWEAEALDAVRAQTEQALAAIDEARASATEALDAERAAGQAELEAATAALQEQLAAGGDLDALQASIADGLAAIDAQVGAASEALRGQLAAAAAQVEGQLAQGPSAEDLAQRTQALTEASADALAASEALQAEERDPNAGLGLPPEEEQERPLPEAGPDRFVAEAEAQAEVDVDPERPRELSDRLQEPIFGPDGFDYHGAERVDPSAAALPLGDLSGTIYDQVFADTLPEMYRNLPPEDQAELMAHAQAEAQLAADRFDALYTQELGIDPQDLANLPSYVREHIESQAREDALHRLNVGHTGGVGPDVDLSDMSEVEQYNYLHDLILRGGNDFREGEMEVNILGVRGMEGGVVGDNASNAYNDTIFVLRINAEGQPEVHEIAATTDYGDYDQVLNAGYGGVAEGETYPLLMAPGAYSMQSQTDANVDGTNHFLFEGWDPDNPITSVPDIDGDHRVDDLEEQYPHQYQGINSHAGGTGTSIGTWSAGCQVVPQRPAGDTSDRNFYAEYYELVSQDPSFATANRIPYTLVEAWDAPDIAWSEAAIAARDAGSDNIPEWDELNGLDPDDQLSEEAAKTVTGANTGDPNAGLGGPSNTPLPTIDELFADWESLSIDDVTTLTSGSLKDGIGDPDAIDLTGNPTAVFNQALESNDFGTLAASMSSIYARDPSELADFNANLSNMMFDMTPEQRAAVGAVMLWQGRQFEQSYSGSDYTQDPFWQQMASVQRAWGDATGFAGLDPMGRPIDSTVSVTGEDYGDYKGQIADLQAQASAEGRVMWTDMDLPYSMWTRQGNIARYLGVDNITFVGEDGLRAYAYGPNGEVYDTVTVQERDAATQIYQLGEGVITLPDGTTAVQTHMGFNKLVEEGEGIRPTGFVNQAGEWVELPSAEEAAAQTTATTGSNTSNATQMVMPGFEHLVDTEGVDPEQAQAVQAGDMPLPDPEAPADDPANAPYMQVLLHRAGFADGRYTIGQQTITLGGQEMSIAEASVALGVDGLTLSDASTRVTQDTEGVLSTAVASGLNIDRNGVLKYTHSRNTSRIDPETGQLDTRGWGAEGSFSYQNGVFNFSGKGTVTRGNSAFSLEMGGSTDRYGNQSSQTLGFEVATGTDKLGVTAGAAITDSQSTRVLDASNANGVAEQTAVANAGGDAILIVGEEHAIRGKAGVNGSNGAFGVGVEVHGAAGTGTYFFTTDGNVQTPDGSPLSTEWATQNPEALHELGEEVGWPNLADVIDVSDVDITQVEVGSGYLFTDFTAAGGQVRGEAYGVGVSLGRDGQDYEAVMVTRTDADVVRVSVASMDEATWNAGVDFKGLPLYQYGSTESNTTLVEFDLDLSTPEGAQAYDIFRDTGALPNSYDQEFVERYQELQSTQAEIEQLQIDAALDPSSGNELWDAQIAYATLQEELRLVATVTNNDFLEDPSYMEHDPVDGVTYAHRMDQQLQADRHTLFGLANWGTSEVHTIDRLWIDDALNVAYNLQREEHGFGRMLLHGDHGRERGGYAVNPHDGAYELGVFADVPLSQDERALLATLPPPEDPMARAYLNGAIQDIDAVAQVGVFLTDNHFAVMDTAFDEMRAAGIDPWSMVHEEMANNSGDAVMNTVMDWDETALDEDVLSEAVGDMEAEDFFEQVIATPPSDFASLTGPQQQVYLAVYLNQADNMDINPWTALDMIQQVDEEARAPLLDQISRQIEREDGDDITGAFQLLELYDQVEQASPQSAELLRTGVMFTVSDRYLIDKVTAVREDPDAFLAHMTEQTFGPGEGVFRHRTQDLIDMTSNFEEYGYYNEEQWRESALEVTTTLMAAEEAGLVDELMSSIGDSSGTGTYGATDLLDAMHFEPGYQGLVLDVLLRDPVHGAEAAAWAAANGVDVEIALGGMNQDPAALAEAAADGRFDPAHLITQVPPEDMDRWIQLYGRAGIDVVEVMGEAAAFWEDVDPARVASLSAQDPEALGTLFRDREQEHGFFGGWEPKTREMTEILLAVDNNPAAAAAFVEAYMDEAHRDSHGGDRVDNMLEAFRREGSRTQVLLAISVLESAGYEDEVRAWREAHDGW